MSEFQQEEKKISTFQDFNSKLLALKTASEKLLDSTNFFARTGTVSDNTALGISVTSMAQVGNYSLTVNQLAHVGQQTFAGLADQTASTISGTFSVKNSDDATNFAISINADGMSLQRLRDAINKDPNNNGKITTTIIDTGLGQERYRLQIKGRVRVRVLRRTRQWVVGVSPVPDRSAATGGPGAGETVGWAPRMEAGVRGRGVVRAWIWQGGPRAAEVAGGAWAGR